MMTHPEPKRVLILGGGEGATLREVLKHACVDHLTMVDIDGELVDICRTCLPEWSDGAFENPKADLFIGDAEAYVKGTKETFDIIISDLTDPVEKGPSVQLFTLEFFKKVFDLLSEDGLFVLQAGSTDILYHQFFTSCAATLKKLFPVVRPYWTFIFSFGQPWGFILASKKHDPIKKSVAEVKKVMERRRVSGLKFYRPALQEGLFALPLYLEESQKRAPVLTEKKPYIWTA
jgi:spermidine synthase